MSYREMFDHAIGDPPPTSVDVDRVVRRQRRAARTRPVVAVLAAAALATAGGVGTVQLLSEDQPMPPSEALADPLAGFPEYQDGTRVVAAVSAPMTDGTLTLVFVPATLDLTLFTRCEGHGVDDPNLALDAEISAGDGTANLRLCNLGRGEDSVADPKLWEAFVAAGIETGETVSLTVTVTEVVPVAVDVGETVPLPSAGTFALAVAEPVPFDEYPLPARPNPLPPLPEVPASNLVLRNDAADPNQRVEQTMRWDASRAGCGEPGAIYPLELVSQTPGTLRVLIEDVEVAHHTWWDYEQGDAVDRLDQLCDKVDDGDHVTIAVEPVHMTGDWRVQINRSGG